MKNLKKIGALLLAAVMLFSLTVTACAAEEPAFSDVSSDDWFYDAVNHCKENGLMDGVGGGQFDPNGSMTRAMLVTALYRRAGQPEVNGSDDFTDTLDGQWYSSAIVWALEQGVMNGYGNGLFGVDDPVTREQLVTIFWRLAGSPEADGDGGFTDSASILPYAVTAVAWARESGIINGKEDGSFDPQGLATRAEVASMLAGDAQQSTEPTPTPSAEPTGNPSGGSTTPVTPTTPEPTPTPSESGKVLVAYFSCTNNTAGIAQHIKTALGDRATLHEIIPAEPYTSADLNYNTDCRANREQNDDSARPEISGSVENMDDYDVVFIGYPIWWGQAPKIIYTFIESYDFSGKTVIPFCTSGSSGIGSSATNLHDLASSATWLDGRRFNGGASASTVAEWVDGLDLPEPSNNIVETEAQSVFYITAGGSTFTADFADNSSAEAFRELLKGGALTVSMSDYGDFEKVGELGSTLPTNDEQITTEPGDVILYLGSNITIYYDTNTWNFTHLGKIRDVTDLKSKLGEGTVEITFSLTNDR